MDRKLIETDGAPTPISAYSQGMDCGSLVFVAGQIGVDAEGNVPKDIRDETHLVMTYIKNILDSAGLAMEDVVKTTAYVTGFEDYQAINEVYGEYFNPPYPARATVQVAGLLAGARVEIEAMAVRRG